MAHIAPTVVGFSDVSQDIVFTQASGGDSFALDNADGRMTLLVKNTNASQAATVRIKAGDGALSSLGDISVSVPAGVSAALPLSRLESARIKWLSGANKGDALVYTAVAAGGSLAAVQLAVLSVL